jgi:hypothetical protein
MTAAIVATSRCMANLVDLSIRTQTMVRTLPAAPPNGSHGAIEQLDQAQQKRRHQSHD